VFDLFAVALLKCERRPGDPLDILFIDNDEVFGDGAPFLTVVECPEVSNWAN
jgi:hypothetical protein